MKVIELTGGVGAGKSRILELLRERFGAKILQADQVARDLQQKGREGYLGILGAFGGGLLGTNGELDREKLSRLIFSDRGAMERVNAIIHPLVWRQVHEQAVLARAAGPGLLVVETAVPDKKPDDIYDEVWYVYTLDNIRLQRLMESRGYSRKKALGIMSSQLTHGEYQAQADFVIDNNGPLREVERQIGGRLSSYKKNRDKDFDI